MDDIVRKDWSTVNRKDPVSLRAFFLRWEALSTNDLSQILEKHAVHVRAWKKLAGLSKPRNGCKVRNLREPEVLVAAPFVDTEEWWRTHYAIYGSQKLHHLSGLSKLTALHRLKKYGIKLRTLEESRRSTHPCCTYQWLHERFVIYRWSLARCASEAGVSPDTIMSWLNRFKITIDSNAVHNTKMAKNNS